MKYLAERVAPHCQVAPVGQTPSDLVEVGDVGRRVRCAWIWLVTASCMNVLKALYAYGINSECSVPGPGAAGHTVHIL
jgi:hypothetical protein